MIKIKELIVHKNSSIDACCVCGREMQVGEHYFKIGRCVEEYLSANEWRFRKQRDYPKIRELRFYCADCVNSIYVDGDA
jgi:hypothetical protein